MRRILLFTALAAFAFSLHGAEFPTGVAGDDDLMVAVNSAETTLNGGINDSVTTFVVNDATGFVDKMVVVIDDEAIYCATVTVATNTFSDCDRHFDGTPATSHDDGAGVAGAVISWHHNALADEIKAIETELGAGMSGVMESDAGDMNAYTEKASPVSADIVIIEDSADSYSKKKVQIGNLPGGGGTPGGSDRQFQINNSGAFGGTSGLTFTTDNTVTITTTPPTDATKALWLFGSPLVSASPNGTYYGVNAPSGYTGDFVRFQVDGADVFQVTYQGLLNFGMGLTSGIHWTLGNTGDTNRSRVTLHGGNAASNAEPAYYSAYSSDPSTPFQSFLFPCTSAGNWCRSATEPGADSIYPLLDLSDIDTESELEAILAGVNNVYTDNDTSTWASTYIVAGGGAGAAPYTTGCAIDGSNNLSCPGTITGGAGGSVAGELLAYEISANGNNYRSWLVPDTLTADLRMRFEDGVPQAGELMLFGAPSSDISDITFGKIGTANIADADWGDFSVSSGVASLDADVVDSPEIADGSVDVEHVEIVLKTRQIGYMAGADGGSALADTDDQDDIYLNTLGQGGHHNKRALQVRR